jgi:signal transduction histidine kinase
MSPRRDSHGDDLSLLSAEIRRWLEQRGLAARVQLTHADGSPVSEATVATLRDPCAQLQRQRSHLERLAALGEVSASMAHEARNVLAGISGLTQLRSLGAPDERTRLIREEAERCAQLLSTFLSFVSTDLPPPTLVSASAVLEPVRMMLVAEAKSRHCQLAVQVPSDTPQFPARANELRQVVLNLTLNALQSATGGGSVQLVAKTADGHVRLQVLDDGPGIAPEVLGTLFEPFVTTKADRGGTGLGLSTALRLVEGMGGALKASNRAPRGACFEVLLPLAEEAPASGGVR